MLIRWERVYFQSTLMSTVSTTAFIEVWNWLSSSGMRNSQGLWNDGLTDTCVNNGQVRNPVSCCTIIHSKDDAIYEPDDMDLQSGLCLPLETWMLPFDQFCYSPGCHCFWFSCSLLCYEKYHPPRSSRNNPGCHNFSSN